MHFPEFPYKHDGGHYRSRRCISGECGCAKKDMACGIIPPPAPEEAPELQLLPAELIEAQRQIRAIAQVVRPPGMSPEAMDQIVDRMQGCTHPPGEPAAPLRNPSSRKDVEPWE